MHWRKNVLKKVQPNQNISTLLLPTRMKSLRKGIRNLLIISVLLANVGCDQISKNIARNQIASGEQISVIPDYFTLTLVENTGAFLSLGGNLPDLIRIPLLMIIPTLVIIGCLGYILKKKSIGYHHSLPIACIIGGGFGNLYDRILHGSVTDFLHLNFQFFQTGIFNLADVSIMAGTCWLFANEFFVKRNLPAGNP